MTDYWLNKLIFDLQGPGAKERWQTRRQEVVDRYPLSDEIKRALMADDFAALQPLANAYLLRNFLLMCGLDDRQSIDVLHGLHDASPVQGRQEGFVKGAQMPTRRPTGEATHG